MRFRKALMVVAAAALPLASVALLEGTAVAKLALGTGSPTCHIGGSISFSPPLSQAGTPGVKKTVTTVSTTLTGCTGGTPTPAGPLSTSKPIKTKVPKGTNAGTCSSFSSNAATTVVKIKIKYSNVKPSKSTITGLHVSINGLGEAGFTASGPISGSYAGTGSLAVYLTQADSLAIAQCSGSISTVHIDSSQSTATL